MTAIVPSSAGTLSIAVVALLSALVQTWVSFKRKEFAWNIWSAGISVSIAIYTLAVFIQFNSAGTPLNRWVEYIQYASLLTLIHAIYGFTFAFLDIDSRRYHRIFSVVHAVWLALLVGTDWIIADQYVARSFLMLAQPYVEPQLGPLGAFYLAYVSLAGLYVLHHWVRYRDRAAVAAPLMIAGFCFWLALGVHDVVCTLGFSSIQFLMEYGFLGFLAATVTATIKTTDI